MTLKSSSVALAAACAVLGCATPPPAAPAAGLGESKATAIEVCRPQGERAYLDRLQCSDGSILTHRRIGSFGSRNEVSEQEAKEQGARLLERMVGRAALQPGEVDMHIVDGYEVSCGAVKRTVYLDMYHCSQEPPAVAPQGFQLR